MKSQLIEKFQHDIPPQIVVNVGSFSIESDKPITKHRDDNTPSSTEIKKGYYGVDGHNVSMVLIKVMRTDDGAILYQNFDAVGAVIVFTTDHDEKITIKPGQGNPPNPKSTVEVESAGILTVGMQNTINGRQHKLHKNEYTIKTVEVLKGVVTLFSHNTIDPVHGHLHPVEYSDKSCRILIRIEQED